MKWWQRRARERDLERELHTDLELEAAEQRDKGLSAEEAQYAARRAFGNATLVKEKTRETWGWSPFERFTQDLRYALRTLQKNPGFTAAAVLTALMTIEIAIGVVVVIGAGLLARSFWRLVDVNPGFQKHGLLTALVTPNTSLCKAPGRCLVFYEQLLDQARSLPGVRGAAAINPLPLSGDINGGAMELEGHPVLPGHSAPTLWGSVVTPDYLATMEIPVLSGRGILNSDHSGSEPVVLVTKSTAKHWWPRENPIGKHIRYITDKQWRTVVGVVADTDDYSLAGDPDWVEGHVYFPYSQSALHSPRMSIVVKTVADPLKLIAALRQTIAQIRPDVPVTEMRTMEEVVSDSVSTPRSTMWLLLSFAALALALSLIGVYAIISYAVAQRTHEIGIRMALGARARDVLLGILVRSLSTALIGLAVGIGVAYATTKVMTTLLFQVAAHDPVTFTAIPMGLLLLVLFATYIPARRATKVDPLVALRHE